MLAQTADVNYWDIIIVLVYLLLVGYLGWVGYRGTKTAADYLVAGRKTHPFIMALSYGATFISTSAIVGFGGVAGQFGMSLLWLTFLNIFVGIFIAFVFLGGPVRRMGHHLDAHTFPEFLGRRFQSRFIQVFAGLVIFLFMPLYAAAVLIGGTLFIASQFAIGYEVALLIFALVVAAYVIAGGLKGVMYTDTLQGVIMFVGMGILLVYTYSMVGGVTAGHQALTDLKDLVPAPLTKMGHQGWTSMPSFGFGAEHNLWWIVVSTIVMGVGIGVLAQPQLVVRFMTVKNKRDLNRAAVVGGIFILMMTGVAFTVGAVSNAYFTQHGPLMAGRIVKEVDPAKGHVMMALMKKNDAGQWQEVADAKNSKVVEKDGKKILAVETVKVPIVLDADVPVENVVPIKLDRAKLIEDFGKGDKSLAVQVAGEPEGGPVQLVQGRSISLVYAGAQGADNIIPAFIKHALPGWFGTVFLLTLLAAAMSTLSSQFHTLGTGIGRDVFETLTGGPRPDKPGRTIFVVRMAIIVGLIVAVTFSFYAKYSQYGDIIIARATAIFFGLCASAFLPALVGGLFWKRMTKAGAIASIIVGFLVTGFWLLFIKAAEASAIGLVQTVTGGKPSLLADYPSWPVVDSLLIALPLSALTAVVVSLMTRPPAADHVAKCFAPSKAG
jgi:solute:Na+ symporter, SSS family